MNAPGDKGGRNGENVSVYVTKRTSSILFSEMQKQETPNVSLLIREAVEEKWGKNYARKK